jgi:hypothetical protein
MTIKGTKDISSAVHWAIAEPQAAYPYDGFIVIGHRHRPEAEGAVATRASSIDSEATNAVLADLSGCETDELFALPNGQLCNRGELS